MGQLIDACCISAILELNDGTSQSHNPHVLLQWPSWAVIANVYDHKSKELPVIA